MKKAALVIGGLAVMSILFFTPACGKKGGGGGGGGCSETALQATTIPGNGTTEPPAPGPDFPLQVTITAGMPAAGVTIQVKAHPDGNATNFFSPSATSTTSATSNFTITGTPAATSVVVDITVTSKSCATNKWTGSYRYSRK
jgi:hypothetical protein